MTIFFSWDQENSLQQVALPKLSPVNPSLAKSISVPEVPYGLLVSLRYLKIRGFGWRAWSTLARRSPKELLRQWLVPQARLNVDPQLVQTTLRNLQKAAKHPPDLLSLALRVALQWDCGEEVEWCRERAVRDTQTPMTLYWLAQYAREFKRISGMPSEFWMHVHSQASETHHWQICAEKSTQTGLHLSYLLAAYWMVRFRTGLEAPFYRRRLGDILDRQAILIPHPKALSINSFLTDKKSKQIRTKKEDWT